MKAPLYLAAGVAAAWASPALAPIFPPMAAVLGVPLRSPEGASPSDSVAITFDDGPHAEGTPAVLEALREQGATATFFLIGEQVERHPSLTAEIVAAGHDVAIHGYRHRLALRLTPAAFAEDLDRAVAAIEAAADRSPRHYRPPYGIFSAPALKEVRDRGLEPILWSRWGHDWRGGATAAGITAEVTEDLRAGDVLLLHDADHYSAPGCWRSTAAAVPLVLEAVTASGLRAGTI